MNCKYIFLDIDGTLVDFHGQTPESAIEALNKAKANGHKLFICTGRQRSQVYPWLLEKVSFDGIIASSGANISVGGERIALHCFGEDKLRFLTDYFRGIGAPFCIQTENALVLEKWGEDKIVSYFTQRGIDRDKISSLFGNIKVVEDVRSVDNAEKLVYYSAPKSLEEVSADIGSYFRVVRYSFGNADSSNGEVTCREYNKATGIEEIMRFFGEDLSASIAIGDGDNDLEMIDCAAVGVAMGNATPALKARADMITTDINENGIANALADLNLI